MKKQQTIEQRVSALRNAMKERSIDAYIIYSEDGHLGEYTPACWKGREWISGFNGSAGKVVVTQNKAGLWTDSRYFLQATQQLEGTPITLYKEDVAGFPTFEEFLTEELKKGEVVGLDGTCVSQSSIETLGKRLQAFELNLNTQYDLLQNVWEDRPAIPRNPFREQPVEYSGESTKDRVERLRKELTKKGANATIMVTLDEVCWAFNIRSNDVDYNPVGVGYGIITQDEAVLFTFAEKVPAALQKTLKENGVKVKPYEEVVSYISNLGPSVRLFVDKNKINGTLYRSIPTHVAIVEGFSIVSLQKSYKNKTEIACIHKAMHADGVALTRFFMWFEEALHKGETPTEYEIEGILNSFRAKNPDFIGDSFSTICGYNGHGAIVHYHATPESSYTIENKGVLLLDSGGQYKYGTTDITRTIALGNEEPDPNLKKDYTLVLKGHISLATAQFPEGTRGNQLDILARKALWDQGLSFGHGTGHGVGVALNVHEGPQNFRTDNNPTPMAINTFTSNEPGLYRANKWGIRIENLVLTIEKCQTEFGKFLGLETVTLCFLDNRLVDKSLLTEKEITWYNEYQALVYRELSPLLEEREANWLKKKTMPL
ncbi:Creatinase [Bacteroidales bacterium KA00251]|nr:Creatinase [Bacteroidales bacterium KA00251]